MCICVFQRQLILEMTYMTFLKIRFLSSIFQKYFVPTIIQLRVIPDLIDNKSDIQFLEKFRRRKDDVKV